MKSLAIIGASAIFLAGCVSLGPQQPTTVNPGMLASEIGNAPKPTPDAGPQIAAGGPVTVSGGSGSTCLAVDVLANDGAFIRRGTAGELSGDTFIVNGVSHDLSGIPYSIRGC